MKPEILNRKRSEREDAIKFLELDLAWSSICEFTGIKSGEKNVNLFQSNIVS